MKYRQLGRVGPRVSAIGLGRGAQPIRFGDPLERDFNAAIDRAIELGITFFDSSDAYWATRHEVLLGRALKGRRDKVLITSKFGNIDLPDGGKAVNGRPEYVHASCAASLERLGIDVIDVYFLHRVDPGVAIEETIGAMAHLVRAQLQQAHASGEGGEEDQRHEPRRFIEARRHADGERARRLAPAPAVERGGDFEAIVTVRQRREGRLAAGDRGSWRDLRSLRQWSAADGEAERDAQ